MAGHQLEEQQAQLVLIRGGCDRRADELLWARVAGCQQKGSGLRSRGARHLRVERLGDSEVEEPYAPCRVDEDVRRLEIAVNEEIAVRVVHGRGHVDDETHAVANRELMPVAVGVDRLALDEIESEEGATVLGEAAIDELGDARVIEGGGNPAFEPETHEGVCGELVRGEDLEGHLLPELIRDPSGAIHRGHSAFAQLADDLEGADNIARPDGRWDHRLDPILEGTERSTLHLELVDSSVGLVPGQKLRDGPRQVGVPCAERVDEPRARTLVDLEGCLEDVPSPLPQILTHLDVLLVCTVITPPR